MKNLITRDRLIKTFLVVSIVTVFIIGLNQFGELSPNFIRTVRNAARSVIIPFAIAFLLSFIINPLANIIEKKIGLSRNISIIIAIIIGILLVLLILSVTLTFIISQLVTIAVRLIAYLDNAALKGFIESFIQLIQDRFDSTTYETLINNFEDYGLTPAVIFSWIGTIFVGLRGFTSNIVQIGFITILTPVFMYYLVKDKNIIFNGILNIFPVKTQKHIKALAIGSDEVIVGYFKGYAIVMIFITIFFSITYSILSFFIPDFNVGYAILFALVMGIFSIIPFIGVWIGMAMPIVLFITLNFENSHQGNTYIIAIALVLLLNIIEQVIESTFIQPKVYSKQVRIHPLAVLSSFIFFGAVFGFVGFILAVPIAGTIKVAFRYFKGLDQTKTNKTEKKLSVDKKE